MNASTLGTLALLAVTAAASPFSLISFSLVLATARGPRNGIAFIAGWVSTVMLIGVAMAVFGANKTVTESNTAGKWTLAVEFALGALLLVLWVRRRHYTGAPGVTPEPAAAMPEPAWQRRLSSMGYGGAFVAGGLVQTWPVMIAAAVEILRLDLAASANIAWMFLFAITTTAGIVVLEVLAWRNPGSAAERLDRIRTYVSDHREAVVNWLFLLGGLTLFFRGLLGLL
jgi:hypothetical protein